jgi:hypothetical protein
MAITKKNYRFNSGNLDSVDVLFANRVVRIEQLTETRNWSDTLDYTDMRASTATYALVWLGTHGVPPRSWHGRPMADAVPSRFDEPRALEFHEQFAWVDCTNMFVDRIGYALQAEVDGDHGMFGDPLMWANLIAWEAHHTTVAEKQAEELRIKQENRAATVTAEKAKKAARDAKAAAKDAILKAEAEGMLARIPAKGTKVTIDGFTGHVFWIGCSKYRGKWSSRAGVKNTKGEVSWISAEKF